MRKVDAASQSITSVLSAEGTRDGASTTVPPAPPAAPASVQAGAPCAGAACRARPVGSTTVVSSSHSASTGAARPVTDLPRLVDGLDRDIARAQAVGEYAAAQKIAASWADGLPAPTTADADLVQAAAGQLRAGAAAAAAQRRFDDIRHRIGHLAVALYVGDQLTPVEAASSSFGVRVALLSGVLDAERAQAHRAAQDAAKAQAAAAAARDRADRVVQTRTAALMALGPPPSVGAPAPPTSTAGHDPAVGRPTSSLLGSPTILGPSILSATEMAGWFQTSGHQPSIAVPITTLTDDYETLGSAVGVRGDLAFAQSILETGYFSFPPHGQVTQADNNFAGIGACDSCPTGFHFPNPSAGVAAQMELLHVYAITSDTPPGPLPGPLSVSGCCPTWLSLTGVWASDPAYGVQILVLYRSMVDWALTRRVAAVGL